MSKSTESVLARKEAVKDIENNKDEVVDSIAEETGMDTHRERKVIEDTIDNLIIDEDFENKTIEKDRITSTLSEDIKNIIKSGKVITYGEITNVSKSSRRDRLEVNISIPQNEDTHTERFRYRANSMSDKLEDLFLLTGINTSKPSELEGQKVPITHSHDGGDQYNYNIHWPPSEPGLIPKLLYKTNRAIRNNKFVSLTENDIYNAKYKPTLRMYILQLILFALAPFFLLPSFIGGIIFMVGMCVLVLTLFIHGMIILETYDYI